MLFLAKISRLRWPKGRGLVVWADSASDFANMAPILREFEQRFPRANIYLCSTPRVIRSLDEHDVPGLQVPLVASFKPLIRWILKRSKARALLVAWPNEQGVLLASVASDQGIPVLLCQSAKPDSGLEGPAPLAVWPVVPARAFVWDSATAASLLETGMPRDDVLVLGLDRKVTQPAARRIVGEIEPFVAVNDQAKPYSQRRFASLGRWLSNAQSSKRWRWMVSRKYRKLQSLSELRSALGKPQTIICLGNGPSSEDGRLANLAHDAVLRVNHKWASRPLLNKPDVVFTGSITTLETVREPTIFAFQTSEAEQRILPKTVFLPRRTDYFVANSVGVMDFGYFGSYAPTNGAVMLATAVALRPKRLVIAGIDLFQNPAGAYPGDTKTPNAYSIGHDPDLELNFILSLLADFPGEITIFSEVLEKLWRERNAAGPSDGIGPSREITARG